METGSIVLASPHLERLLILTVLSLLLGIGLASTGPQKRGVQGLAVLTLVALALDSRYFWMSMHDSISFFIALYDPFTHIGLASGGVSAFFHSTMGRVQEQDQAWNEAGYNATTMPGLSGCLASHSGCGALVYYKHHPSWAATFYSEVGRVLLSSRVESLPSTVCWS